MNYVLPKEAKTSKKYSSLPDDLKKLADELIGKKFKEVEVAENNFGSPYHEQLNYGHINQMGGRIHALRAYPASINTCYSLIGRMHRELRDLTNESLTFYMSDYNLDCILSESDFRNISINKYGEHTIFGIIVKRSDNGDKEIELVYNPMY